MSFITAKGYTLKSDEPEAMHKREKYGENGFRFGLEGLRLKRG